MLTYIDVSKIIPHPDNPRKDLGDLLELADSIRANGILQNLTVVPLFDEFVADGFKRYRVVIGHRRLAAAKLAGLKEVPCIVTDMDPREQVATMLLENMQRNDLTLYEQAQGFQMMLDFGDSVNDIAERTGFSETTIRRRVKLLEFDQEKFKESVIRGGTLQDYAELNKIEDPDLRNSVLDEIGTPNFQWELKNAINTEERNKKIAAIVEKLKTFAIEIEDTDKSKVHFKTYYIYNDNEVEIPEDANTTQYYYVVSKYGYITLYIDAPESGPVQVFVPEEDAKQKEVYRRRQELEALTKQAYELRAEFISNYSTSQAKQHLGVIMEYAVRALLDDYLTDYVQIADFLNIEIDDEDEENEFKYIDDINNLARIQPERHLLIAAYLAIEDPHARYFEYWNNCKHRDDETLNTVYDFLTALGYEMSDEEQALRAGTHELFMPSED